MSKIKSTTLPLKEWAKQRLEQLQRIDQRIDENASKYRIRKSSDSEQSARKSGKEEESRESADKRESGERQYDELANDWRKLQDTIEKEVPEYMGKHTGEKAIPKIQNISDVAKRIRNKIDARLKDDDLAEYRYKQNSKKWESKTATSALRQPRKQSQQKESLEEVGGEEGNAEASKRSLILEDINEIGRQTMSQHDRVLPLNQKLVDEYEIQKKEQRMFTRVLLALILILIALDMVGVRINTQLHRVFFDFLQA